MEYRYNITPKELEDARKNHGFLANYYRHLKGAKINDVMLGIYEDDPTIAIPIFKIESANGELFTCELLSAYDLGVPGCLYGLPLDQ